MARVGGGAVVILFVLAFMLASAAAAKTIPKCCQHFHQWGPPNQKAGCALDQNDACDQWCQPTCRGGECKIRDGGKHVCHCYC
ncbi:hypothetical protein QOZ80_6AG0530920 [Eleusine coracana subsp. coracana]|nr:hypothetical protein QOZ80_6AG0530920 [Eleusine coracana subsp. coracana]